MTQNFKMIAKTLFGFEAILAAELQKLGAINVKQAVRSVSFEGDIGFMYKANLCLRTAIKILKPIQYFKVRHEKDLYDEVYRMNWKKYIAPNDTFAIDATVHSEKFNHSKYVALKTKDALVDKLRNTTGKRPNVDINFPNLRIHIHIQQENCTISLDSSGKSLHQRGYRTDTNKAPINEVLAAGILLLSGWNGQSDFLDPMCGSGTLLIEAAMIACNIPPNINRREFAFEKWQDFDADLFAKIVETRLKKTVDFSYKITGYDKSPSAVKKAEINIKNANLQDFITVKHDDFFKTEKYTEGKLHLVFNPPYGERLPVAIASFYKQIGDTLKQHYPQTDAWFITSNSEGLKNVGLRTSKKIKLFNGNLESRLVRYEMYTGSKKIKKD